MIPLDPVTATLNIGSQLIDRLWPNQVDADKAKLALMELVKNGEIQEMTGRSEIVKAEGNSEHWLTASWRPILMLVFGSLIVARWFGFSSQNISTDEYIKLWDIVELGIGGYVIGRSAEKIIPDFAKILRK